MKKEFGENLFNNFFEKEQAPRIAFYNIFSPIVRKGIRKQLFRAFLPIGISISLIVAIPTLIFVYRTSSDMFGMLLWGIGFIAIALLLAIPKDLNALPTLICITENVIVSKSKFAQEKMSLSDVSAVFDFGTYYQIRFSKLRSMSTFFCVKDSITIGDIDAFEKLFEGKIVRKRKSDS